LNTNNRRTFSTPSRIALSVLAILASAADAQAVTEWDLPGQPLATTLRDIAARTESNIIFDKKLVKGQAAPPLKTRATTEEALSKVLEGTGLTYRQLDDKTVTIQLASTDPASATSYANAGDGRIRLAQAQTGTRSDAGPSAAEQGLPSVMLLEEIVVTGTNIRNIENNTAPVTVLTREYINATGYSTVSKLIESLPQNFALANESGQAQVGVTATREQGSSVNLRGIGEGTTLVLLNGRRLAPGYRSAAVDISALPLSAIERVEILPDGASALYGSDAVGGVVNFILRDDFEGAETRLKGGVADSVNEYRGSQAVGNSWDSGNALFSVEYSKRDMLSPDDRDFVPTDSLVGSLRPETESYSGIFTGQQDLSGSFSVFADGLYSRRDSDTLGRTNFLESTSIENEQIASTLGMNWNVGADWQVQLSGSYAKNESDLISNGRPTLTGPFTTNLLNFNFDSQSAELKADGTLFTLPGGNVSVAVGGAYRSENYQEMTRNQASGLVTFSQDVDQDITSAFAELYVPIFGEGNRLPGLERVELSLAGRYDDYSTAGSSTDPQAGLMWEPVKGFRLRARYGTSYKAPNLLDYNTSFNIAASVQQNVPGQGSLQVLTMRGTAVNTLSPQESETASFGLEFTPESVSGLAVSMNYYKIEYTDIIATPVINLGDTATYGALLTFNPSLDQVNQAIASGTPGQGFRAVLPNGQPNPAFTPASVQLIVDARRRNLSLVSSSGVDLSTEYNFAVGPGRMFFGINGTYVLNRDTQITDNGAEIDTAGTIYNPPDWRARGLVSYQVGGFGANMFVNHTDSYIDNRILTGIPGPRKVDSLTTLDVRFAYDFSSQFSSGLLSGFAVALAAQNVLDEDPPALAVTPRTATGASFDLGFDPINADPLGRLISLEFTKSW
jgi:outer membrane receptor protein involved in Fe transport